MRSFSRWFRLPLLLLFLSTPLIPSCGSSSDDGGPEFPSLTCNNELLAGGTYIFTITQLGSECFSEYEALIRGIFDGTPFEAPSYDEILTNPTVTLTVLGVTISATIVEQSGRFTLTDITPNPVQVSFGGYTATATINSAVICPTTETAIVADLNATVVIEGIFSCRDTGRITGILR